MQASSTDGKQIRRLTVFDGLLIPSYGSYNDNDGPHDLIALDLGDIDAGWTSEATFQTEELYTLRALGDVLYAPFVDPRGGVDSPSNGQVARRLAGSWEVLTNVTPVPVHVWDTAVTADGWWLFGSSELDGPAGTATIWRSIDNGATWTTSLGVPSGGIWNESVDAGARFYGVQQYTDGTLIATLLGAADPEARAYLWNGSTWSDVTDADTYLISNAAQVAFTHQGVEFFLAVPNGHVSVRPTDAAQRATIQTLIPGSVIDAAEGDDGLLYVLNAPDEVWSGTSAGVWTKLLTLADNTARSLAVHDGWLYVGTTTGHVGRVALPA